MEDSAPFSMSRISRSDNDGQRVSMNTFVASEHKSQKKLGFSNSKKPAGRSYGGLTSRYGGTMFDDQNTETDGDYSIQGDPYKLFLEFFALNIMFYLESLPLHRFPKKLH